MEERDQVLRRLVGRRGCHDKQNPGEAEQFAASFRDVEMSKVNGIEAAAQNSQSGCSQ
jgi:hypothetical protein